MTTDDPGDQYDRMLAAADKLCKAIRDMRRDDKFPSDPNHLEAAAAQDRVYRAIAELTDAALADDVISSVRAGTYTPMV
jgi:hypothetical protein